MKEPQQKQVPVMIAGAGPTGLTLAAELARHGVDCRIVDKAERPTPLSKATSVQARTLELLHKMGVVDEVLAAGHVSHGVNLYSGNRRLMHFSYDDTLTPYPFTLNIPQSEMERILGSLVDRLGLRVEWQTELVSFTQDDEGVTSMLRHADGQEETVRSSWLAGCDGSHSTVRHSLNIPFEGHTYSQWFGLADARIDWELSHDELHGFVHREGVIFIIPMPGDDRYRINMEAEGRSDDTPLTLDDFQTVLNQRGLSNARLSDPGWMTPYRVNARRAATHCVGRVFIAGDASHIHSPAGGQGMNTGIQDAYNLAWKLGMVAHGYARPELLDSYDAERTPVAEAVLRMTDRLTTMLTLQNTVGRELRDHLLPIMSGFETMQQRLATQDAELDITYRKSPVVAEHHHGRFGHVRFVAGPRAGDRALDAGPLQQADGSSVQLYDILRAPQHTLLLFGGPEPTAETLQRLRTTASQVRDEYGKVVQVYLVIDGLSDSAPSRAESHSLLDVQGQVHQIYHADSDCLYLVRPDGYMGFRSRPADAGALRDYLVGVLGLRTM
jgi:2-polyprenyl-6-methoxyphenol hydroxylase-like FAD-dependent oxidoreductase